jgi:hypothetical protein
VAACAEALRRLRSRISIWTSQRGAEALAVHGLTPDLIIIQHASDLDAYFTVRHLRDRDGASPIETAPVVLAEPKTPLALIERVEPSRMATFDPACGWGLWPASLAWLAAASGARAVSLCGIDLGTNAAVDPLQQPLRDLLGLIASGSSIPTVDGGAGALKPGWARQSLDATVGAGGSQHVTLAELRPVDQAERYARLRMAMTRLQDHLDAAAMFRTIAREQRAHASAARDAQLAEAWAAIMTWGQHASIRTAFQEELGVSFLPRFWRTAEPVITGPHWRPVLLACEEITQQALRAHARLSSMVTG